ncbi:unnamed protein product [Paramecium pentaurelia]|uniref:Myb-like DNA-binding domain protein n=1 Tax=Paramecium pentaurelia TaxID=43138 RepID=A0A8S1VF52_9CILI|nr:unnamed protein product [Paramecium pentaurelia]
MFEDNIHDIQFLKGTNSYRNPVSVFNFKIQALKFLIFMSFPINISPNRKTIDQQIYYMEQKNKEASIQIKKRKHWTSKEDKLLEKAVQLHNSNWKTIAEYLIGRNASQCQQRWKRIKPYSIEKRNFWSPQEDELLKGLATQHHFEWKKITGFFQNRSNKQIRERYINHLDPLINKNPWTEEEDQSVWALYQQFGPRWSKISSILKGRPENSIKNRFYGHIRQFYAQEQNPYYIVTEQKKSLEIDEKEELQQRDITSLCKKNTIFKNKNLNNKKVIINLKPNSLDNIDQSNMIQEISKRKMNDMDFEQFFVSEQQRDSSYSKQLYRCNNIENYSIINFQSIEYDNNEDSFMQIENRLITSTYEFDFMQNQQPKICSDQNAKS